MIARTASLYLLVFIAALAALSAGAYVFMDREYASLLAPALGTPEGVAGLAASMRHVLATIIAIDTPLVILFALASYVLARAAIEPLTQARERERIFAAESAHALRTPLTVIASVAQASQICATGEDRDAFATIAGTALEASSIVDDLLTLARLPARTALSCEPLDLAAIVMACAKEFQTQADARGITVDASVESAIVDGDQRRIKELARNLTENALRHARRQVRIAARRAEGRCEIVVDDDGDGIPPEDRERIFERFYHRSYDGSGSGLGLAIAAWIATAHQGKVSVEDAPLGGARLVASFPALVSSS